MTSAAATPPIARTQSDQGFSETLVDRDPTNRDFDESESGTRSDTRFQTAHD